MSFKKYISLIIFAIVALNFAVICVSFNFLMSRYIKQTAEQEIKKVSSAIQRDVLKSGRNNLNIFKIKFAPPIFKKGRPNPLSQNFIISTDLAELKEGVFLPPSTTPIVSDDTVALDTISLIVDTMPRDESFIDMNFMLFNKNDNARVFPKSQIKTGEKKLSEIEHYYSEYKDELKASKLVRAKNTGKLLYLSLIPYNSQLNVMLYSDLTNLQSFSDSVNYALISLLILSSVIAMFFGLRMSKGINKALLELKGYAKNVGGGLLGKAAPKSKYSDINELSLSLEDMSNKLANYDEKQKTFFQNVSHEMRTPLMSIQGYSDAIINDIFDDPKEAAEIILSQSNEMNDLVQQLLYIARMDNSTKETKKEPTCINEVLSSAIEKIKICSTNIRFVFSGAGKNIIISANYEQLMTAFINILLNCARYSQEKICISLKQSKDAVTVRIIDDGPGIDSDDLPYIFDRFYMGKDGNAGLGLAITKDIIQKHNGTIEAFNNNGAEFLVTLPKR